MNNLPDQIKRLRIENGLTQEQMAKKLRQDYGLKTDRVMISKWETGFQTPEIYTISCIADLFGVSLDYLNGRKLDIQEIESAEEEPPLLNKYNLLNAAGKQKALEYIDDLLSNPRYASNTIEFKPEEPEYVNYGRAVAFGGKVKESKLTAEQDKEVNKILSEIHEEEDNI